MKKFTVLASMLAMAVSSFAIDVYMIGAAIPGAGWSADDAVKMDANASGTQFTYTGEFATGEFKFTCEQGSWFPRIVAAESGNVVKPGEVYDVLYGETDNDTAHPDAPADYKFYMFAGSYTMTLDLDATTHNGTLTITGTPDPVSMPTGEVYIIGSFAEWAAPGEEMQDEGNGIWSYEGVFMADDNFKFRWAADWWPAIVAANNADTPIRANEAVDVIYLPSTFDAHDNKIFFEDAGTHTVYLDTKKMIVYIDNLPTSAEETTVSEILPYSSNGVITIDQQAEEFDYAIYSLGSIVKSGKADSISMPVAPGIYVVVVNGVATKLMVK